MLRLGFLKPMISILGLLTLLWPLPSAVPAASSDYFRKMAVKTPPRRRHARRRSSRTATRRLVSLMIFDFYFISHSSMIYFTSLLIERYLFTGQNRVVYKYRPAMLPARALRISIGNGAFVIACHGTIVNEIYEGLPRLRKRGFFFRAC